MEGLLAPIIGVGASVALALFGSAIANAATITWPASVAAGDVAVLFDVAGSTGPAAVTPSGFTNHVNVTDGFVRNMISSKVCTGSESGSLTGMSSTTMNKVLLVFRGGATTITPSTFNSQQTAGDPTLQTVAASGGVAPLVVLGMAYGSAGSAAFSTASPAFDGTVTTATALLITGYKIYNSAPANHSIDMNDLGSNFLASGYLAVA